MFLLPKSLYWLTSFVSVAIFHNFLETTLLSVRCRENQSFRWMYLPSSTTEFPSSLQFTEFSSQENLPKTTRRSILHPLYCNMRMQHEKQIQNPLQKIDASNYGPGFFATLASHFAVAVGADAAAAAAAMFLRPRKLERGQSPSRSRGERTCRFLRPRKIKSNQIKSARTRPNHRSPDRLLRAVSARALGFLCVRSSFVFLWLRVCVCVCVCSSLGSFECADVSTTRCAASESGRTSVSMKNEKMKKKWKKSKKWNRVRRRWLDTWW